MAHSHYHVNQLRTFNLVNHQKSPSEFIMLWSNERKMLHHSNGKWLCKAFYYKLDIERLFNENWSFAVTKFNCNEHFIQSIWITDNISEHVRISMNWPFGLHWKPKWNTIYTMESYRVRARKHPWHHLLVGKAKRLSHIVIKCRAVASYVTFQME